MYKQLQGWNLDIHRGWRPGRALRTLEAISGLVPPRVLAAVFRTWWDGWSTCGRFGIRTEESRCVWGCSIPKADHLKNHYACCPHLHLFGRKRLGLPFPSSPAEKREEFLLLKPNAEENRLQVARGAIRLYAAYWVHNKARHWGYHAPERAKDALKQGIFEGVWGHPQAVALVDNIWKRAA